MPSLDQVQMLKLGRQMRDGVNTEFWKAMQSVIQSHITTREAIVHAPLHTLPSEFAQGDFATRAVALESVKGALIALKLVATLPDTIIAQASEIAKENSSD